MDGDEEELGMDDDEEEEETTAPAFFCRVDPGFLPRFFGAGEDDAAAGPLSSLGLGLRPRRLGAGMSTTEFSIGLFFGNWK